MHWTITTAEDCIKRGDDTVVIETGTSISGIPHLGNASDVIRGEAVRKAVELKKYPVELIWVADDSDPFRNIPKGMDSLSEYLGFPVKDIPDPDGCHDSFVDHFAKPFLDSLKNFGVNATSYSGTEVYRSGALIEQIRKALEKREEIIKILNKFRGNPLPADYIPWTPICSECGKISTTNPTSIDGDTVSYNCTDVEVKGGEVTGCGYEGESNVTSGNGKLPWRVEWAARWDHFKVSCEPFGKDHASAGGSYWTSKIISEKIFNHPAPVPVIYEFLTLNGDKISSSKGNVITPTGWMEIAEPEVLNYFMYKKLNKQRDIDLSKISNLTDEYDEAERIYFSDEDSDLKMQYQISQVGEPKRVNVPFTLCAVLAQVVPEIDKQVIVGKVSSQGYVGFDEEKLLKRVELAGRWVEKHGPEHLKFKLNTKEQSQQEFNELGENEKTCLIKLSELLDNNWTSENFHKQIYDTARENDVKPQQIFKAIYKTLINQEKGPKAASFILALGGDYIREIYK